MLTNARRTGAIQGLGPNGKAQASEEYQGGKPYRVSNVVVSCQHSRGKDLDELRSEVIRRVIVPGLRNLYPDHETEVLVNPSGRFVHGGFEADTGLTGRKLMADTYGGLAPPRRRGTVRKGWRQGRPQRRLHAPVHRQKYRGAGLAGGLEQCVPGPLFCHRLALRCAIPAGVIHKTNRNIGIVWDFKGRDFAALNVRNNLLPLLLGVLGGAGHVPVVQRYAVLL